MSPVLAAQVKSTRNVTGCKEQAVSMIEFVRHSRVLRALLTVGLLTIMLGGQNVPAQQSTLEQLEARLQKQYEDILDQFANGPAKQVYPLNFRDRLRLWQGELALRFAKAGSTIDEILQLNPPNREHWIERRETMTLYSGPVGPPQGRTVFGSTEVKPKAKLLDAPPAIYPDAARAAGADGEVRLRLVLASDGTVKNVFPMKALKYGMTEAAMDAARQIKFTPAERDGQPASQFTTLSYEFKKGKDQSRKPYVPLYEFYF